MHSRLFPSMLSLVAVAAHAAANEGGAGNTDNSPEAKFYLAEAAERNPAEGKDAEHVTFVIAAEDYKTAWQRAREVTRIGTAEYKADRGDDDGVIYTSTARETAVELRPGRFTIKEVKSLQDRSRKPQSVTLDNLLEACEAKGVSVPKAVRELIDELKTSGPLATDEGGAQAAAG